MNGSAPTSRAVASARQAYASQRVAPVGDPTGDTEDLSDTGDMGPPPRIVAMPMSAQLAAPVPLAVGTAAIVEAARAEMARLDGEIARLGQAVKDREMLAAMLAAVPQPLAPHHVASAPLPVDQPIVLPAPILARGAVAGAAYPPAIAAEVARIEAETAEEALDAVHAAEVRAWQAGGPMPSWMR